MGEIRAQAELTDGVGRGHRKSPTNRRRPPTLSVVTAQTAADGGSATALRE